MKLSDSELKALKRVIGFVFSFRDDLSDESKEDLKIVDDLYHKFKKEAQK